MSQVDKSVVREGFELTVYGFVDSIEPAEQGRKYSRLNIIFDSASLNKVIASNGVAETYEDIFIIRIMTTSNRFKKRFNINPRTINEGEWYKIMLRDEKGEPPAWVLPHDNNFSGPYRRTNIVGFEAVTEQSTIGDTGILAMDNLRSLCHFTPRNNSQLLDFISQKPLDELFIRKVDVGQGCCATFHLVRDEDSPIIGYYDVGYPLPFNKKTEPPYFSESRRVPDSGFILLSHWDYDHYFMAVSKCPKLQSLTWYAPHQPGGPMVSKFKAGLGANLNIITVPRLLLGSIEYIRSLYSGRSLNNSGYYIKVTAGHHVALLVGDIDYKYIAPADKLKINALAISHHGGKGANNPPPCIPPGGTAVVSYGANNAYHHPYTANINDHLLQGWDVTHTADTLTMPRGYRWLY